MKKFIFMLTLVMVMFGVNTAFGDDHDYPYKCSVCGTSYYWGPCQDSGCSSGRADHTYSCSKCGTTICPNNTSHTCVCTHEYEYTSWTYGTSTYHTREGNCKYCDSSTSESAAHSGGTATCTSGSICSVCGGEYGSATGHTVTSTATCSSAAYCDVCGRLLEYAKGHTSESYWRNDETGHWKECVRCSYKTVSKTSHVDTSSVDGICDVCSYEVGHTHTLGSWTTSGSDHIQTCTTCQKTVNTHTPTWNYATYDSSSHTKTCSTCSISETETHTDISPVDNTCDKCGETLSTSHEHNYNTVCSVCNSYYYGTCTVSGCSSTKEAHSYSCSTCGTTICPNQTTHTCSATGTYRNVIKAKGTLLRVTSLPGSVITIIPKTAEITGWEVEEGNITILNNMFTMPAGNVVINAIV